MQSLCEGSDTFLEICNLAMRACDLNMSVCKGLSGEAFSRQGPLNKLGSCSCLYRVCSLPAVLTGGENRDLEVE